VDKAATASSLEQLAPVLLKPGHPEQRAGGHGDEVVEPLLPLDERQVPEIPTSQPEQVKGGAR
jgi:hypothetical protein